MTDWTGWRWRSLLALAGLTTALLLAVALLVSAPLTAATSGYPSAAEAAIHYSRTKLLLSLVATAWSGIVLAAILFTGLSARIRDSARRILSGRRGVLPVYILAFGLLTWLLALPLDYYSGFVVEHQFGLSTETAPGWLLDHARGFGLNLLMGIPVAAALYWMIRRAPRWWWLGVAGLFILLTVILATLAPVVVSPMFNSYRPIQDRALADRIETMASGAGVKISEVLEEDTSQRTVKANAYFTGIGPTKRIVLTDNLLNNFTSDEIVVVVAHELGHQVHNDIWRSIALGSGFYLVGAYLLYRMLEFSVPRVGPRFGFGRIDDVASLPLSLLLFGTLSFMAMPALNSFSRQVEHQADVYALELTHDPASFISAMEKLGRMNLSDPNPPKLLEVLFYDHPSIQERVDYARSLEMEGRAAFVLQGPHPRVLAGSASAGSSEPLKPSSTKRVRMDTGIRGRIAALPSTPVVLGRKLFTTPRERSVFSIERAPSASIPVRARMQSTFSGIAMASLWTWKVMYSSLSSAARASAQTATSHMSLRGRRRSRISSMTEFMATSPSAASTKAIRGVSQSACRSSSTPTGRVVSTIAKWR